MYRRAGIDGVRLKRPIVRELLPRENETDLIDLDALLLLQCLLHRQYLIFGLEVECLLATGERFDEDLIYQFVCACACACEGRSPRVNSRHGEKNDTVKNNQDEVSKNQEIE